MTAAGAIYALLHAVAILAGLVALTVALYEVCHPDPGREKEYWDRVSKKLEKDRSRDDR